MASPETESQNTNEPVQRTRTVDDVTMESGVVEFHDLDGVVSGRMSQGAVVRGGADLTIEGQVAGDPQHPCNIEVAGSVTIEKSVEYAKIQARELIIWGDVIGGKVQVDRGVEIQGEVSESEFSMGNPTAELAQLRHVRTDLKKLETQLKELDVRIGLGGRRFLRDYPQVNLQMGSILVPDKKELKVDLQSFYQAVKGRPPEVVDKALQEFYLRVMVGSLTRENKHYISRNPSRHKIFLKLIEDLRGHILSIREADKLRDSTSALKAGREIILKALVEPPAYSFRIGGKIGEGVSVQLLQFAGFEETPEGTIEMDKVWAEAKMVDSDEGNLLELKDIEGNIKASPIEGDGLENGSFGLKGKSLVWSPAE
jgi:hypothetical protein